MVLRVCEKICLIFLRTLKFLTRLTNISCLAMIKSFNKGGVRMGKKYMEIMNPNSTVVTLTKTGSSNQ